MFTDLAHTAFAVHDMDRALAFYAKLGLHESFRLLRDDGYLMLVYLHIGGDRFLELFPNGPDPEAERVQSFRHICLKTDDLQAAVQQLQAAGITIDRGPSLGKDANWQAWITDPDGNPIELMQISPESPQGRIARGEAIVENEIIKAPSSS